MGQKQSVETFFHNDQLINCSFKSILPQEPTKKRQKEATNAAPSNVRDHFTVNSFKENPENNCSEITDKDQIKMTMPAFVVPVRSHALYNPSHDVMETSRRGVEILPESVRKSLNLDEFSSVCSEILPDFLYIGNEQVARNHSILKEVGITHIINCCPEACGGQIDYSRSPQPLQDVLVLILRDGVMEDLILFFWQVIEFIENASSSSSSSSSCTSKILIHCHQGISRSCAFGIAYVMYKQKLNFHDAMAFVKSKRSICSPNSAFLCQLIEFEKELTQVEDEWNIYRLAPHAPYDPKTLVLKPCYENLHSRTRQKSITPTTFHSKGCFVVLNPLVLDNLIYIWLGKDCKWTNAPEQSVQQALRLIKYKQKYRKEISSINPNPNLQVIIEKQGEESEEAKARAKLPMDFQVQDSNLHGYEIEFEWLISSTDTTAVAKDPSALAVPVVEEESTSKKKPLVYLLEKDHHHHHHQKDWEQLRRYDSDDLVCDCILLVISFDSSSKKHFLWIGNEWKQQEDGIVKIKEKAIERIHQVLSGTTNSKNSTDPSATFMLEMIYQYEETEEFWETFELGYEY